MVNKLRCFLNLLISSAVTLVFVALAQAQSNRTFVSAEKKASDKNSCTHDDPCRSIRRALDATLLKPGGEVVILDSGDYDPFTISNSANPPTVTSATVEAAPGVYAGITAPALGKAITIQASASDTIVLRDVWSARGPQLP